MAVRLQMKLGVVAEQDRLPDSPDTVVVVEPSVGSVARSKGHLYLLVTSRLPGQRAHEATRLTAETIRNEYYYDESAGVRACLEKAVGLANKRLGHQGDRLGLATADEPAGPIGVAVVVVRGTELYVATLGPAEAYLVRQARLSTRPDTHRERGLPAGIVRLDVWKGEIQVGDELLLISSNVVERLGFEELKDALVTLHPQSAMDHLHHRFVVAGGTGSDAAVAFEAAEVVAPVRSRDLVAGRSPEPQAERSRIPLVDAPVDGVAALGAGASQVRAAAGSSFERAIVRFQDLLPVRRATHRRVSPLSARRETQRRAAVAALAFITVAFGLGMAVFLVPRDQRPPPGASAVSAGQRALDTARANLARVFGPGLDLVADEPEEALTLLTAAYEDLDRAGDAGIAAATIAPLRAQVLAGLERLYEVTTVDDVVLFAFDPEANPRIDLAGVAQGPDGAPYVLDRTTKAVWRINVDTQRASLVVRDGTELGDVTAGRPKFVTAAAEDLLVLDVNNVLWRWRPANEVGRGALNRISVDGAAGWGNDIAAIGTYLPREGSATYNLYVVDPSEDQILSYVPAAGEDGFPTASAWLNTPRPLGDVTSIHIDGDLYLADAGSIERFAAGQPDGWEPGTPGDELVRDPPIYQLIAAASGRRAGPIYAYDRANARVLAFDKSEASFIEQYRLPVGNEGWADMRAMYVVETAEDPPLLVWVSADVVHASSLAGVETPGEPGVSPGPDASAEPSAAATP